MNLYLLDDESECECDLERCFVTLWDRSDDRYRCFLRLDCDLERDVERRRVDFVLREDVDGDDEYERDLAISL